ncbi:MAG: MFS transporter [Christensenellales bacterium]
MKKKKQDVSTDANAVSDVIPGREKLCYGIGGFMDGGAVALMSCIMLKYMTSALGIAMAVASTIMMVAKIWDAITDPLMGFISDNTRGRWGRRKPYMVVGGALVVVALLMLFLPVRSWGVSVGGCTAYVLIFYLVWNTVSTLTQVPYCSMSGDISPSFRERNNANTVKLVFTSLSSGICYVVPLVLIEAMINKDGYLFMSNISPVTFWLCVSLGFGILFGGGLIICGIFVKERVNVTTPKVKFNFKQFVNNYVEPYKNRSYRWHIAMYCTAFMCMDMISALAVYYATDVWHGYKLFGMDFSSLFIVGPLMVAAVIIFPLGRILMDKKSKQFVFRMGLPFYILGGIMFIVMDPSWTPPILVPIVSFIMGLGFGGAQMMPWMIFPDTVDVAELATGKRPTGTYSGMMTLARKVAGAFAVGMVGWIIGGAGYIENTTGDASAYIEQPESALLAIKLVMGIAIAVFITLAMISSFRYKVTSEKLKRIRYFNELGEQGKLGSLSDEEKAERIALIKELAGKYDEKFDTENVINRVKASEIGENCAE